MLIQATAEKQLTIIAIKLILICKRPPNQEIHLKVICRCRFTGWIVYIHPQEKTSFHICGSPPIAGVILKIHSIILRMMMPGPMLILTIYCSRRDGENSTGKMPCQQNIIHLIMCRKIMATSLPVESQMILQGSLQRNIGIPIGTG